MQAFTLGPDFHVCLLLILKPELCGLVDAFSGLISSELRQGFRPVETCKYMNYLYVLFLSVRRCLKSRAGLEGNCRSVGMRGWCGRRMSFRGEGVDELCYSMSLTVFLLRSMVLKPQ